MDQKLIDKLLKREKEGTLRSLSHLEGFTDFFSNDYLGLSKIKLKDVGSNVGSTGSRLISGNSIRKLNVEDDLAYFFNSSAALMFNSGYDANLGLFGCVPQRGDTILYDEYIHASVRDGIQLSHANSFSFKHNDCESLESKLKLSKGTIYVAVEGLYSMDGDVPPLIDFLNLCDNYGAKMIIDEAHSAGIYGHQGKGLIVKYGLEKSVFARLVTFGKAYGSHGAVVLGSKKLIDYLINFSRSFIYTTALPDAVFEHNSIIVRDNSIDPERVKLQVNIDYFRENYKSSKFISDSQSPIQIVELGSIERTRFLSGKLQHNKVGVKPIYSPTVPVGKERIRLCLHSTNSKREIDELVEGLLHDNE